MSPAKPFAISKRLVWEAYKGVKANQGAAGVDAESVEQFERKLAANLYKIWNRMSSGTYFPAPVRTVAIPKKDGGQRQLGIPTVADRIAQRVVALYLEPLVEPPNSTPSLMDTGRSDRHIRRLASRVKDAGATTG